MVCLAFTASGCNLSAESPTLTPQADVPTIEFQYPTNASLVVEGTEVQIQLLAQDPRGVGVARVELYVDDQLHQQGTPVVSAAVTVFTVSMNWLAEGIGMHALYAIAVRPDGTSSEQAQITLEVIPPNDATPTNPGT
jgi:hypothetical protein